jgi:hypothetical protein
MLVLSTAYLPPVEYFVYLTGFGKAVIDLNETYHKQTWRNRCTILSGNGPVNLVVPVEKPFGNHTPTHEIIISNHAKWNQNHWKTISSAYRSAPYFVYYSDMVRMILLEQDFKKLPELNNKILLGICQETGIQIETEFTQTFIPISDNKYDLRFVLSPKANQQMLRLKPWYQVFEDRYGFCQDVSILDLLFNIGPDTNEYLHEMAAQIDPKS